MAILVSVPATVGDVPTIVAKREGILDLSTYDAPRGRGAWREEPDTDATASTREPVSTTA